MSNGPLESCRGSGEPQQHRHAGGFAAWLASMQAVLRDEQSADVPCDGCVGCCVSAYPIPLRPTDEVALQRVPDHLLQWPRPRGTPRMGFREDGSCPMLAGGCCSIYDSRPQTCRDYDCRLYTAAGLLPDGQRPVIQERVRQWRFTYEDEAARAHAAAIRDAAAFIRAHADLFPPDARAHSATAAAVMAVKVHGLFMDGSPVAAVEHRVREVMAAAHAFDGGTAPDCR